MKSTLKALVVVAGLGIFGVAQAQDFYAGASVDFVNYDEVGAPTANPTMLTLKVGGMFNPNFALEGRVGFNMADDTVTYLGVPINFEVSNYVGAYARGILPMGDVVSLYGLAGFTSADLKASAGSYAVSGSDSGLSLGFGMDAAVGKNTSVTVEWVRLLDESGYDLSTLSVGANIKF